MIKKSILRNIFIALIFVCSAASAAFAQTTAFTYQGRLTDTNNPANGDYEMQFRLFDNPNAGQGTQIGATFTIPSVTAIGGIFTAQLDFDEAVFAAGADLYLEISLRPAGSAGGYTSLAPRQRLTSAPYSIRTKSANAADSLSAACVGCVTDNKITSISGAKVTGTVANATTAGNVTGIVAIANGGTGSSTKNFVDLTNAQTIAGEKTFSNPLFTNTIFSIGEKPGSSVILGINQSSTGFAGIQGFGDGVGATPRYGVYGNVVSNAAVNSAGVIGAAPGAGNQNPGFRSGVLGVGGPSTNIPVIGIGDYEGVRGINTSGLTSTVASYGSLGFTDAIAIFGSGNSSITGTKSFVDPHPTDPDKIIRYVSLEGPEAGTYFRGRAKFVGKQAVIEVPESFRMVTAEEGLSIQVTPIGEMATVAVVEISLDRIVVKASENVEFFYTVNGVRRGFEDFEVIVKADREFTPTSADARMPTSLSKEQKRRLIATGIYNPDGTVNMATARKYGWDKQWAK